MSLPPLWPWQAACISEVPRLLAAGYKQIAVTTPTGMGKTREMSELARWSLDRSQRTLLYTNRRLLTEQTGGFLTRAGLEPGYIAAGFDGPLADLRIASVQTVLRRMDSGRIDLPESDLVLVDECHSKAFDRILDSYKEAGVPCIGFTATPVDLASRYQTLLVAGKKAEGRSAGALVRCDVFAPVEPDLRGVRWQVLSEKNLAKRVMQCTVFADVFDHWRKLNPEQWPTLLWAPGVPESRWFVQKFLEAGVSAAHVDGETDPDLRRQIQADHQSGAVKVVSSYGVLREGIDWPWVRHGIGVQVWRDYSTYLQCVGRLLRAYPGKEIAILQDHAGAWHRHGSPNLDRDWTLADTDKEIALRQRKRREAGLEGEPICCPRCHGIRSKGPKCPHCGYEHTRSVRMVRTEAGELKKAVGNTVKRKPQKTEEQKVWTSCIYAGVARNMTVRQIWGWWWKRMQRQLPPDCFPRPPAEGSTDWERTVSEVYPNYCRRRKPA